MKKEYRSKICVIAPKKGVVTETFVQGLIEKLPYEKVLLYGSKHPLMDAEGRSVMKPAPLLSFFYQVLERTFLPGILKRRAERSLDVFLRKQRVDAVLALFGTTGGLVEASCRRTGIPLLVHFYGIDAYSRELLEKWKGSYERMFKTASAFVVVSREMVNRLQELGGPAARIHYIVCGADLEKYPVKEEVSASIDFIAVGRFVEKKGPFITIMAFYELLQKGFETRLIMVGEGPLWGSARKLVKALGIESRVDFKGYLGHEEVGELMHRSLAFVQHSVEALNGDKEGTPVGVLEAMGAGIPVIATRHAGIQDVVVEGKTGILVEELDLQGMSQAMEKLASDPDEAFRMGQEAREHVKAYFSMDRYIVNMQGVIEEVLDRSAEP